MQSAGGVIFKGGPWNSVTYGKGLFLDSGPFALKRSSIPVLVMSASHDSQGRGETLVPGQLEDRVAPVSAVSVK